MPVSCVIPFYNEAQRLGQIVNVVLSCNEIDEVILVDDGSTDGGFSYEAPKLVIHRFRENKGKAEAMRYGFNMARFDTIMFIDADLKGLRRTHIRQLLEPILSGMCDMAVSMREYISFFDVVSGERALSKSKWKDFFERTTCKRNAMEIAMNHHALSNDLSIRWISWEDVSQTYKSQKTSWFRGVYKDVKNVADWMFQIGVLRFGCTYLLAWLFILDREAWFTRTYLAVYLKMYGSGDLGMSSEQHIDNNTCQDQDNPDH